MQTKICNHLSLAEKDVAKEERMMILNMAIREAPTGNLRSAIVLVSLLGFMGCKQEVGTTKPAPIVGTAEYSHDHAAGDENDHSVAGHGHGAGPHDGTIADWGGGKYHVELTVDHDKNQATAYVLGGDEKTSAPIDADTIELNIVEPEMTVTLSSSPADSDPAGTASRFIGTHEKLGVVQEYEGSMTGVIDGTPYTGEFKEESHDHE